MKIFLSALAIFLLTASALADFASPDIDVELVHSGPVGASLGVTGGAHDYDQGSTDTYAASLFGLPYGSWQVTSPPDIPAAFPQGQPIPENLLQLDFAQFNGYADFSGETATFTVSGLTEDVIASSLTVFTISGQDIMQNPVVDTQGTGFSVDWSGSAVLGDGTTDPLVYVGWNSVPAPGALALLSLAGLTARRRRRRR